MSAHGCRMAWNKSFEHKLDRDIVDDVERVTTFMKRYIGPPYGASHHEWVAIRGATLREARRRGLDPGALAPK